MCKPMKLKCELEWTPESESLSDITLYCGEILSFQKLARTLPDGEALAFAYWRVRSSVPVLADAGLKRAIP